MVLLLLCYLKCYSHIKWAKILKFYVRNQVLQINLYTFYLNFLDFQKFKFVVMLQFEICSFKIWQNQLNLFWYILRVLLFIYLLFLFFLFFAFGIYKQRMGHLFLAQISSQLPEAMLTLATFQLCTIAFNPFFKILSYKIQVYSTLFRRLYSL